MTYLTIFIILVLIWLFRRFYFNAPKSPKTKNMNGKVVIITGSSAGIGKETARDVLKNGATVVFACRDEAKTKAIISELAEASQEYIPRSIFIKLNLCSLASVYKFVQEFKKQFNTVDILINNAGCLTTSYEVTEDKIENTMQGNHIGHMVLTNLLLEHFDRSEARIINLSSNGHTLSDLTLENIKEWQKDLDFKFDISSAKKCFNIYCITKLANVYFTNNLAGILEAKFQWAKTFSLHPGFVNSELTRYYKDLNLPYILEKLLICIAYPFLWYFSKDMEMGAQTSLYLCYESLANLENGAYFENCAKSKKGAQALDKEMQIEFMKYSWMLIDREIKDKFEIIKY